MVVSIQKKSVLRGLGVCILAAAFAAGCGALVDKDNIRIAKIGNTYITRGDLNAVLRDMPAEERPDIRTKGDVLKALQAHIDSVLKMELAERLEAEGKLHVPRELAEQRYYMAHPEERNMEIENPEAVGLTPQQVAFMKENRELAIDRELDKLRREAAVGYLIQEELKNGVRPTDAEYEQEYEFRKDTLVNLEAVVFRGVYFPASQDDASAKATDLRKRLKAGGNLDELITEFTTSKGGHPLESGIENNPALPKFYGFWQQAAGSRVGDVIGPLFIRGWDAFRKDAAGKTVNERLPDSYLVCQVVEHRPESPKTFEQAKPDLAPAILYAKVMEELRGEKGVEIYEDKLPDPSLYDQNRPRSVFDEAK